MPEDSKEFTLILNANTDSEELAELGRRLRSELLELNVERVDLARGQGAPIGAKGDPITLATLGVTLAPIVLTELMKTLQTWLSRHERASVTVEKGEDRIVVTGSPSKDQQKVVDDFLRRHST